MTTPDLNDALAKELERRDTARREFIANVTHELQTPIAAIKGAIETLQNGALNDPQDAQKFVEILSRHANRLGDVINGLLSLSLIEQDASRDEMTSQRQPIKPILESAIAACAQKAEAKNISITLDCDDSEATVNPLLMERAVANLIDNAIRYSETTHPIRIRALTTAGELQVRIEDSGIGIPEKHIPHIFDRFYRVNKTRSRAKGGSGLGLAIVKRIIEAHGGRIAVKSARGDGASFTIHLPLEAKLKASTMDRLTVASQRYYQNLIDRIYLFDPE